MNSSPNPDPIPPPPADTPDPSQPPDTPAPTDPSPSTNPEPVPPTPEEAEAARKLLLHNLIRAKHTPHHFPVPKQRSAEEQTQQRTAIANAALSRTEFDRLQQLSDRQFSFDACCSDDGSNKLCNDFASPSKSFLEQDVSGHHVWLNPPVALAESCLDHMLKCWHKDSDNTSACILLPASMAFLASSDLHSMRLLHKYSSGSRIFQSFKEDGSPGKQYACSSAMHVYMLDRKSTATMPQLNTVTPSLRTEPLPQPLAFTFDATCFSPNSPNPVPIPTTVMDDSGASTRFASLQWVTRNRLPIKPTHKNWKVKIADNTTVHVVGTVDVILNIQGYQEHIKLIVMPMSSNFDIILGTDWNLQKGAIINYRNNTITISHKGRDHVLHPKFMSNSIKRSLQHPTHNSGVLKGAKARKKIAKREAFPVEIQRTRDLTPEEQAEAAKTQPAPDGKVTVEVEENKPVELDLNTQSPPPNGLPRQYDDIQTRFTPARQITHLSQSKKPPPKPKRLNHNLLAQKLSRKTSEHV